MQLFQITEAYIVEAVVGVNYASSLIITRVDSFIFYTHVKSAYDREDFIKQVG